MSKPGCIVVNAKGERFGNEASVHFVDDMHANGAVPAHIIGDAAFVKKYGMGMVYPGGGGLKKLIEAGYVAEAPTLSELARKIGVDRSEEHTSELQSLMRIAYDVLCLNKHNIGHIE